MIVCPGRLRLALEPLTAELDKQEGGKGFQMRGSLSFEEARMVSWETAMQPRFQRPT